MDKFGRGPFLAVVLLLGMIVAIPIWLLQKRSAGRQSPADGLAQSPSTTPTVQLTATPSPSVTSSGNPSPQSIATLAPLPPSPPTVEPTIQTPIPPGPSYAGQLSLIIPVSGVKANQLRDTFSEARSEGRVHDAIDIPAPQGTPVLAAADGEIVKLFQSERGGTTIYQLSTDKKLVYYYAHLQRYAEGLAEGKSVRQGEVIAYVGDTGNAGAGNYHLHFSIAILADPKRYWEGTNINPYPLLHK